jgi:hypothetical protein
MTLVLQLYLTLTAVLYVLAAITAVEEDRPGWFVFCATMAAAAGAILYFL